MGEIDFCYATTTLSHKNCPTMTTLKGLLRSEGPGGLFRGAAPILLRAFPANAAAFLGYELAIGAMARAGGGELVQSP